MKTINSKNYYRPLTDDTYIDIPNEVFDIFEEHRKTEHVYQLVFLCPLCNPIQRHLTLTLAKLDFYAD